MFVLQANFIIIFVHTCHHVSFILRKKKKCEKSKKQRKSLLYQYLFTDWYQIRINVYLLLFFVKHGFASNKNTNSEAINEPCWYKHFSRCVCSKSLLSLSSLLCTSVTTRGHKQCKKIQLSSKNKHQKYI